MELKVSDGPKIKRCLSIPSRPEETSCAGYFPSATSASENRQRTMEQGTPL